MKKNVPWHILAPRRGCFGNHLPLRRVRILAERFYRMETKFPYDKKAPPILQNIVMNILQNQRGSFIFYKSSARCGALENSGLSCFIWNRLCKNHSQDALLPRFSLRQASTAVHRVCSD